MTMNLTFVNVFIACNKAFKSLSDCTYIKNDEEILSWFYNYSSTILSANSNFTGFTFNFCFSLFRQNIKCKSNPAGLCQNKWVNPA